MNEQPQGLLHHLMNWAQSARYSTTTVQVWLLGLALILVIAFLWSTVVRDVLDDVAKAA